MLELPVVLAVPIFLLALYGGTVGILGTVVYARAAASRRRRNQYARRYTERWGTDPEGVVPPERRGGLHRGG